MNLELLLKPCAVMSTLAVPCQTVITGLANNSLQKSGVPSRSCRGDLSDN